MKFVIEGKPNDDVVYSVGLERNEEDPDCVDVTVRGVDCDNDATAWYVCSLTPGGLILYDGIDDPNLKTDKSGFIKVIKE